MGAIRRLRSRKAADCTLAWEELGYRPTSIEAYEFFCREGLIEAAPGSDPRALSTETPDIIQP